MPVLFSRACEYGLRVAIEMARDQVHPVHLTQTLAARLDIPAPFLAKVLQLLVKKGFLQSSKGRRGGFSFARNAEEIRLIEIVEAIDGLVLAKDCVMGLPACGEGHPCPIHASWGPVRETILEILHTKTLGSVARELTPLIPDVPELVG